MKISTVLRAIEMLSLNFKQIFECNLGKWLPGQSILIKWSRSMKLLTVLFFLAGWGAPSGAESSAHHQPQHEMQHGFVLSADDRFASHLVATGHHSRQTEITGHLVIEDPLENEIYLKRKAKNIDGRVYFLLQAQGLDLPSLKPGQVLRGHIVESEVGKYEHKNVILKDAKFVVEKILLNMENPFFGNE
jgi:hypothetical protein